MGGPGAVFVCPTPLPRLARRMQKTCKATCSSRLPPYASQNGLPRSSSALNQGDSTSRYIDLRTMQVIRADDAHLCDNPNPAVTFGIFDNSAIFDDPTQSQAVRQLLFTPDTIPLSDSQKDVVQSLLARRSVLYSAVAGDEKVGIFIDIVMRNRLWKECVVYCAQSQRAAETVYAILCAQLGAERRSEVRMDLGHGSPERLDAPSDSLNGIRVVITSPQVLRTSLFTCDSDGWAMNASIVFIDDLTISNLLEWEEILLSMPSKVLFCIFSKELGRSDQELLPLWLETVQNSLVGVSPMGAASLLDRIERPDNFPLLRTFVYNAALHKSPVQVSLTLLKDMYQKEVQHPDGDVLPSYTECFLHGITMIPAEDPAQLMFRGVEEAEYADLSSLVVADAKRTCDKVKSRRKRARSAKRKERTASSRAAARRRREAAYADSTLLPAIALIKGKKETDAAALAIKSALDQDADLLWDEDTKDHVEDIVESYRTAHEGHLSASDMETLDSVLFGVGVVNQSTTPSLRALVEELLRAGLIPILIADTHMGSRELNALPSAKSVLMESSCMATRDDQGKGLIMTSTAASLAGRAGKDDVGNLIVLWYDDAVDDETAGYEIASTLFHPIFVEEEAAMSRRMRHVYSRKARASAALRSNSDPYSYSEKGIQSPLSSSYDGVLRAVRRFGLDGYESIFEYTLSAYKGWLERAALRATLEKAVAEKTAIDDRLNEEDWSSIADHERREAKMNEVSRVLKAMESRYDSVRTGRLLDELRNGEQGRIIGVVCSKECEETLPWEQKLLEGGTNVSEQGSGNESSERDGKQETDVDANPAVKGSLAFRKGSLPKKENISAAVFVSVLDQSVDGKRIKGIDSRYLVVCILADGMWTMLPLSDVVAVTDEEEEVLPNVDLLMMPHPATFDVDPVTQWAKCSPIDNAERAAVHRASDELIAKVAGDKRPQMVVYKIPEFEAQRERMEVVQNLHRQSPWYGRDDEILELRRLRRRAASMSDEIKWLEQTENQLEEELFQKHNNHRSIQLSLMAVLEDCHAVYVLGDHAMEMTPIGSLAAVLPSEYPVFASACLALIEDVETLSPAQMAGFTAVVVCTGRIWQRIDDEETAEDDDSEDDEPLDLSMIRNREDAEQVNMETETQLRDTEDSQSGSSDSVLPARVKETIHEIQQALQQLHRRHLEDNDSANMSSISDIVPTLLNFRLAEAASAFVDGCAWPDVVKHLGDDADYAVREMRRVKSVLAMIARDDFPGEFSEGVKALARSSYNALNKWPVHDSNTIVELVESGVIEKHWNGNTYDKWWRTARDAIGRMNGRKPEQTSPRVQAVEAEIIESS